MANLPNKVTVVPGNRGEEEIYEEEAHKLVDEAIENATRRLLAELGLGGIRVHGGSAEDDEKALQDLKAKEQARIEAEGGELIPNIEWMSAGDFTVQGGISKIEEFLTTWTRDPCWLHCIDFLREEDHPYSMRYRYAVKWSIPTRRKPIPRATACTYFTIEVSKVKPKTFPVEVYYIFESNRLVHRPGRSRFREKWLKDIVDGKIGLMKFITF